MRDSIEVYNELEKKLGYEPNFYKLMLKKLQLQKNRI